MHNKDLANSEVTILTYGMLLKQSMEAAKELEQQGTSVRVVNMRTLDPVDTETIMNAVKTSEVVVTVEDHFKIGGLYSIVCETMVEHQASVPVVPLALDGKWFTPGRLDEVLETEGFTPPQIVDRIRTALNTTKRKDHVESTIG